MILKQNSDRIFLFLIAVVITVALFFTAPLGENMTDPDAARHAMNGIFILDMVKAFPDSLSMTWMKEYYIQYPGLSIGLYPPGFSAILAVFYSLFGASHAVAQAVVLLHIFALIYGMYYLALHYTSSVNAMAAAALTATAPIVSLWARSIMLDPAMLCYIVWAAYFFVRYIASEKEKDIWCAVLFTVIALYIKMQAIVFASVMALSFILFFRAKLLRKETLILAVVTLVAIAPLAAQTLMFGVHNLENLSGAPDLAQTSSQFADWFYYIINAPQVVGWPIIILLLLLPLLLWFGKRPEIGNAEWFLIIWFAVTFVFFSSIDLKSPRHIMSITPVVALLGIIGIQNAPIKQIFQSLLVMLAAVSSLTISLMVSIPEVNGYRQLAAWVATNAEEDTRILFSGFRTGNFVYSMRLAEDQKGARFPVVRADKLIVEVRSRPGLIASIKLSETEDIKNKIIQVNPSYILAREGYWAELAPYNAFNQLLVSDPDFIEVDRVPLTGAGVVKRRGQVFIIYKNTKYDEKRAGEPLSIGIPLVGIEASQTENAQQQ